MTKERPKPLAGLLRVAHLMHWPMPYASAVLSAADALMLAHREGLDRLAVMSSHECIGIALVPALAGAPREALLIDCVSVPPVWVDPGATIEHALELMQRFRVACLVCVRDGRVGLLNDDDARRAARPEPSVLPQSGVRMRTPESTEIPVPTRLPEPSAPDFSAGDLPLLGRFGRGR